MKSGFRSSLRMVNLENACSKIGAKIFSKPNGTHSEAQSTMHNIMKLTFNMRETHNTAQFINSPLVPAQLLVTFHLLEGMARSLKDRISAKRTRIAKRKLKLSKFQDQIDKYQYHLEKAQEVKDKLLEEVHKLEEKNRYELDKILLVDTDDIELLGEVSDLATDIEEFKERNGFAL